LEVDPSLPLFQHHTDFSQSESISEVRDLILRNTEVLKAVAGRSSKFRESHPWISRGRPWTQNAFGEVDGIFGISNSTADTSEFSLDDEIIHSAAYRRAFAQVMREQGMKRDSAYPGTTTANLIEFVGT
jgi:hypothetical protein